MVANFYIFTVRKYFRNSKEFFIVIFLKISIYLNCDSHPFFKKFAVFWRDEKKIRCNFNFLTAKIYKFANMKLFTRDSQKCVQDYTSNLDEGECWTLENFLKQRIIIPFKSVVKIPATCPHPLHLNGDPKSAKV